MLDKGGRLRDTHDVSGRKYVLYVEDNPANFTLVRRLLESTGNYEVAQAPTGEQGLDMLQQRTPDVLLLDLDLPGISGIDVAREVRKRDAWRSLPIIVVTASVMKRERVQAEEAGADRFIEKPFDIAELRRAVDEASGVSSSIA